VSDRINAMENIFTPKSIAFVGASKNIGKWGGIVFTNLVRGGYEGSIYPVNPKAETILDHKTYKSVSDIPGDVDLAIFTIPAAAMPDAISDCVAKGVKAGVVITAGFGELGEEGRKLQNEMVSRATAGGMVLVGPNGQGIAVPRSKLFPWLPSFMPEPGEIGIASQSGSLSTGMSRRLAEVGFGSSKVISVGNCADLSWPDYIDYFRRDSETNVVMLYIEGINDGREFFRAAKKLALEKPVVIIKSGKTSAGAKAAATHTGSIANSDAVFDAACRQAGIVRAERLEQAVVLAAAFIKTPLPRGRRLCILTEAGGEGVMTADAAEQKGLDLIELSDSTIDKLKAHLPPWWAPNNPVDTVAGLGYGGPKELIPILMESPETDGVIYHDIGWIYTMTDPVKKKHCPGVEKDSIGNAWAEHEIETSKILLDYTNRWDKPLLITSTVAKLAVRRNYEAVLMFLEKGVMVYPTLEDVVDAFAALAQRYEFLKREGVIE